MYPIWYINTFFGVVLQVLMFGRAARTGLLRRYPLFYVYLTYTTLWSLVCSLPFIVYHPAYAKIYWCTYLVAAVLRFGIVVEVHRHLFPAGSALRNRVNLIILFSLCLLGLFFGSGDINPAASVCLDSARKLAVSVAVWDFIVLGLAHYYGVRIGRNIWGMGIGLLTFLGAEFFHLAAMDLLPSFRVALGYIHPVAFVTMLMVWTYALWDYHPNPRCVVDEDAAHRLLSIWQEVWAEVPQVLRKVVKS